MTEEDAVFLCDARTKFWLAFSKLCNEHLRAVPEPLRPDAEMMFGEVTSIYGRDTNA